MDLTFTSEEHEFKFLDLAKELTNRIATLDPALILDHNEKWSDNENKNILFGPDRQDSLTDRVKRYKRSCEHAFLINKRKCYELTSLFARNMLCRTPIVSDALNKFGIKQWCRTFNVSALLLIDEMHDKWRDKKDLSLFIPPALESDKKKIIAGYLRRIQSLNIDDEAEGTYAYLLHDYCRILIIYNCAMQFIYGADLETLRSAYGEYAEEAFNIYDDMLCELTAQYETEDTQYEKEE